MHRLGDAGLVDVTRVVLDSVLGLVSALAGLIVPTVVTSVDAAGVR